MPNLTLADLQGEIQANVRTALAEDVGGGDLTAQLIDPQREAEARVITREHATIAAAPGSTRSSARSIPECW